MLRSSIHPIRIPPLSLRARVSLQGELRLAKVVPRLESVRDSCPHEPRVHDGNSANRAIVSGRRTFAGTRGSGTAHGSALLPVESTDHRADRTAQGFSGRTGRDATVAMRTGAWLRVPLVRSTPRPAQHAQNTDR